jgi:two-component system chemotaxis response regulator CheB
MQPIVITQHMPPSFTTILADHIKKQCGVRCEEAKEGDILRGGDYYIAPGDFHMLITKKPEGSVVHLVKDPPENYCRPAVDPMLRSLVAVYGGRILAVILTGMGQDGTKGGEAVVNAGGGIVAQDEATSVVWGMPGSAATAGLCSVIAPISEIGSLVRKMATQGTGAVNGGSA